MEKGLEWVKRKMKESQNVSESIRRYILSHLSPRPHSPILHPRSYSALPSDYSFILYQYLNKSTERDRLEELFSRTMKTQEQSGSLSLQGYSLGVLGSISVGLPTSR